MLILHEQALVYERLSDTIALSRHLLTPKAALAKARVHDFKRSIVPASFVNAEDAELPLDCFAALEVSASLESVQQ